jgi:hypothetical protein
VAKAVEQAKKGDHRARDWLGRQLVGSDSIPLQQLVEELKQELEGLKHVQHAYTVGNGEAVAGRIAPGAGS